MVSWAQKSYKSCDYFIVISTSSNIEIGTPDCKLLLSEDAARIIYDYIHMYSCCVIHNNNHDYLAILYA